MDLLPWMEQWHMLPDQGGTILCAVSGGRDSLCLLHYVYELAPRCGFTVAAGHLNHKMRATAQRDEAFVRAFCARREIPFYTEAAPVYEQAKEWKMSVEETGRRLRYDFLDRTADAIGAEKIATAHHALDQAETVVLHLLRGTGPEGLAGIPPVRGRYIRPLLQTPRREIEDYMAQHKLAHVEDETNEDLHYARNRLRREIWPQLTEMYPSMTEAIVRSAAITRRENDYLNELAGTYLPEAGTELQAAKLRAAPEALQSRIVRLLIDRLGAGRRDVTMGHIDDILRLADTGGTVSLPGGMEAVCRSGVLRLGMKRYAPEKLSLRRGTNHWGDYTITVGDAAEKISMDSGAMCLCCDRIDTLCVRGWRAEDRMQMPRGSRSVKRLFSDAGVAEELRCTVPVICVGDTVAAVYGAAIDERFLPQSGGEIYISIARKI